MYKHVTDLTQDELDELATSFFWDAETQDIIGDSYSDPSEIPDWIIFRHYDGVAFVNDDFYCNAGKEG